jgi:hypothetical protein
MTLNDTGQVSAALEPYLSMAVLQGRSALVHLFLPYAATRGAILSSAAAAALAASSATCRALCKSMWVVLAFTRAQAALQMA